MSQDQGGLDLGLSVKQVMVGLGLVFMVTLAVVVGKKMSTEAMAVVVGVVCGVGAGIPTSVLLMMVLNRRDATRAEREEERRGRAANYPPVVVIQGGSGVPGLPAGGQAGYWPMPMPGPQVPRQFHVVGGDDLILDAEPRDWRD